MPKKRKVTVQDRPFLELGAKIRAIREKTGLSQERYAEEVKSSRSWLAEIESGKRAPGRELLLRIAAHAKVGVDDIVRGVSDPAMLKPGSNYIIKDGTEARLLFFWSLLEAPEREIVLRQIQALTPLATTEAR